MVFRELSNFKPGALYKLKMFKVWPESRFRRRYRRLPEEIVSTCSGLRPEFLRAYVMTRSRVDIQLSMGENASYLG